MTSFRMLALVLVALLSGPAALRAQDAPAAVEPTVDATEAPASVVAEAPPPPAPEPVDLHSVPTEHGLPVVVHVGLAVVDLITVDENEGVFEATIDLRTTWPDARLGYPAEEAPGGWKSYRGEAADARLAEIWTPQLRIENLEGDPSHERRGLRISPSGQVEFLYRLTARFQTPFDVTRFPFDRQQLRVDILSESQSRAYVSLVYRQDDLNFTTVREGLEVGVWHAQRVTLHREVIHGWHGESHDEVRAEIEVRRTPTETMTVFIPLFASLLIPLLAIWLNRFEDGEFKIEAFELANVIVGGLFAVIALNFTLNETALGSGDNTVSRLFSLNYITLATSFVVNLAMFRYRVLGRRFGPFVEEQAFLFIAWAVPVLAVATATAFVAVAYA